MKSFDHFSTPKNLTQIINDEGYWEDESYDPIFLSAEEISLKGNKIKSFQISFPKLEEYEGVDGITWEAIVIRYVQDFKPELAKSVKSKSVSKECILCVENEQQYKQLLGFVSELLNSPDAVESIYEELFT